MLVHLFNFLYTIGNSSVSVVDMLLRSFSSDSDPLSIRPTYTVGLSWMFDLKDLYVSAVLFRV